MDPTALTDRLESAITQLEHTLTWLDERQTTLAGEVEKISATIEQTHREEDLAARLATAERELADLKAAASHTATTPTRKTLPTSTAEMLAKHGIGEGPVDLHALDAALTGLSLEQRIAVKNQLRRAGALA